MQKKKTSLGRNLLLIGLIVVVAVVLIIVSQSQRRQPAAHDINNLLQTLGTVPPAASGAPAPTAAPAPTPVPNAASLGTLPPASGNAEAYVLISVDGNPFSLEPLDQDRDVQVPQADGKLNVVHITHNGFRMESSTCDNQLCVHEGEVTTDNFSRRIMGGYVLCLPNRVALELVMPHATLPPDMPDI